MTADDLIARLEVAIRREERRASLTDAADWLRRYGRPDAAEQMLREVAGDWDWPPAEGANPVGRTSPERQALDEAVRALLAARDVINEEIDDLVQGWSHGASGKREAVTAEGEAELKPWENALSEIDTALAAIRKLVPNAGGESDG